MAAKIKVAVLGTGSLGKEHVRIYAELAKAGQLDLAGVYDTSPDVARRIAQRYQTRFFPTFAAAVTGADAFSVVTPTNSHFELSRQLLEQRRHVLVEKPMTDNAA